MPRRRTGLLGGSFDPVHVAHIALADTAYTHLGLDDVQLIPAANPWQRAPLAASGTHRIAMLKLAIGSRRWLHVNPVEIQRGGQTFTIDTLRGLPDTADYYWILGADQLVNFCSWQSWREVSALAQLVVANRPGSPIQIPEALDHHLRAINRTVIELPFSPLDISATEIRRRLSRHEPVDHFLAPAVMAYIRQHRLYDGDVPPEHTL